MKLVYFLIILCSAVFYVLYMGDLSFYLLAFLLAMPVVLYAALAIGSAFLKIKVYCDSPVTERGKAAAIKINLYNRSFLPVSSCMVKIRYTVSAPFEEELPYVHTAYVPIGGRTSETVSLNFLPKHCGAISVTVRSVRLRDLMGITSVRKKVGFSTRITVLPAILPVPPSIESNYVYNAESSVFSREKPGDDPSEIFMLREYRDGDRHNLIHWKLSGRSDNFIVRELSKPVGSRILIMADTGSCRSAEGADRVLEAAASVSCSLAESGAAHTFAVPCLGYSLRASEITDTDSLCAELAEICRGVKELEYGSSIAYVTEISDSVFIANGGFSRVIAVSEQDGGAYADELSSICGEARLTVICTASQRDNDTGSGREISAVEFIYADAEKLSSENFGYFGNADIPREG
ncbi:MAG: DUF58 domain-containing protein [Oscillospiraceae bacterium]|nr:DUF58 domain-containing protein [Oscillospiraceae bacterium]